MKISFIDKIPTINKRRLVFKDLKCESFTEGFNRGNLYYKINDCEALDFKSGRIVSFREDTPVVAYPDAEIILGMPKEEYAEEWKD